MVESRACRQLASVDGQAEALRFHEVGVQAPGDRLSIHVENPEPPHLRDTGHSNKLTDGAHYLCWEPRMFVLARYHLLRKPYRESGTHVGKSGTSKA